MSVHAIHADITTLDVDAIVNAADNHLLGGGGVDGAIHAAAGPDLLAACAGLGGCETGFAKITPGFALPARWVIHTVGPVWVDGQHSEADLLAACYRACLGIAAAKELQSIAFPAISTGVFGYPKRSATAIAVSTVTAELIKLRYDPDVIFCCYSAEDLHVYQSEL